MADSNEIENKTGGGGKYKLLNERIRHIDEKEKMKGKALKLQAHVYKVQLRYLKKEAKDFREQAKGYVTRKELWAAIVFVSGLTYFLLNYFRK